MGRKRSAAFTTRSGLEPAFPSAPKLEPRYSFYCYNGAGLFMSTNFYATYAAKRFIEAITHGTPYKWIDCCSILAENGVKIRTTTAPSPKPGDFKHFELEEVLEYEPSAAEKEWVIPAPYSHEWPSFAERAPGRPVDDIAAPVTRRAAASAISPTSKRPARAPKTRSDDMISVADIAGALGISPKVARDALRRSPLVKPDAGWAWAPSERDSVTAVIKEHMK